ncbi:MAG: LysR family transcriptional regulator [Microbacterium sp.]|uniref:LysR family transcriptional regulator n=1 Tax=Microbacterium sp. TaxID=51671 RepID=UPI0039E2B190
MQRFPVTLTQLTYFVECAKTLNMTVASQQLLVAQSAVSTAITHLERALGASLFIRKHSKGLVLTPAGERLLRDTGQVFGLLSDAIEAVRADQLEVRGTIRIACFATLAPFLLPQLLTRLQARHPELVVDVVEGDHAENLDALQAGRVELAVGYNLTDTDGVRSEIVGSVRPYVIVHSGHRLAGRPKVRLAQLADEPLVLLDLPGSSQYLLGLLLQAGVTPRLKYRSSSYETVRSLVSAGHGFSILNQRPRIAQTYSGDHAVAVEIADRVRSLDVVVASLAQVSPSARARAVAAVIRELIAHSAK